jgi:acyl-ACP thioesterase
MEDGTVNTDNVIENPADKVVMPKDVEPELALEHVVAYSDVDMNAHANNAMYMHWAMNAVGYELTENHVVKSWTINFNNEIKPQEEVGLYRACLEGEDGLHVFIEGKIADKSAFIVEIVFA